MNRFADKFTTAEERAMLMEAYAETYPVRPLLNDVDRLLGVLERIDEMCDGASFLAIRNAVRREIERQTSREGQRGRIMAAFVDANRRSPNRREQT